MSQNVTHLGSALGLDYTFKVSTTVADQMVVRSGTALVLGEAQTLQSLKSDAINQLFQLCTARVLLAAPKMNPTRAIRTAGRPKGKKGPGILVFYVLNGETVLSPVTVRRTPLLSPSPQASGKPVLSEHANIRAVAISNIHCLITTIC